ncbi:MULTISPECIES: hypothetical protein [Sphingobacterium]|uniref:hypothetical protein n=1 Tax=Sphingobacterium TaxID=28453 RepID=UPI000389F197|nr:hypothetical protein [Sphingobacterium sp. IITKGP-BTPF85]KKX46847.1 hypothetical protein L950_0229635 [Sphingobacterium sp. IITKGP-BTPF85]
MAWYQLNSNGNPTIASNYSSVSSPSCSSGNKICAINATDNGSGQPVFTTALQNEMILALHTATPSTNVQLRNTP